MVGEEGVIMSVKELRRVPVIRQGIEKKLTQVQVGDHGLAHWGRGKPSNRRLPETVKATALTLYAQR